MSGVSKSEYIRWVKGTLNRLLGASLPDDGSNTPEYRMWLMSFQTNQKLTVNAQVDLATQNALIKRNRVHDAYVRWVQNALLISGEGIRVGGKAIVANGYWGSDTEQAVKDFQSKHENMKGDGWVGAKTERALMLRTGTVPPGRTRVLRGDPGYIPVFNDDGPLGPADPADDIPDLSIGFRFKGSAGVDLSVEKFGIGSGLLELDDLWNRKTIVLSYAALGLGLSPVPASISYSSMNMASVGRIYPNPVRGQDELTLDDITGWCLIYQGQFTVLGLPGGTGTLMFLSLGAGLVSGFLASMTGIGTLVAPALLIRSCRGVVAMAGVNRGTPNAGVSGAVGYLSRGDARAKIDEIKDLVGA